MTNASIIIIENDTDVRNRLMRAFEDRGYITWSCPAPEIAVSIFSAVQPNVVLLDLDVGEGDALVLLRVWKEVSPDTKVVVKSTCSDEARRQNAIEHGADAYFVKPFSLDPLFAMLEKSTLRHERNPKAIRAA